MGTCSYKCKALVFSTHKEKVFAEWKGHFLPFWYALSVQERNVYSLVLMLILLLSQDWERDNYVVGTKSYVVGTR